MVKILVFSFDNIVIVLGSMSYRSSHSYSHYLQGSESRSTRRHSTHNYPPQNYSPVRTKHTNTLFPHLNEPKNIKNAVPPFPQANSLERYQLFMQSKEEEHLRRRRYEQKKFTMRLPIEGIRVNTEILNTLAREVRNLRRELSFDYESKRQKQTRLITELAESQMIRERLAPPTMPVPYILPVYIAPQPQTSDHYRPSTRRKTPTQRITVQRPTRGSFLQRQTRKKTSALWKKLINCTLFVIYFRRYCRLSRESRKMAFTKFYKEIDQRLSSVRVVLNKGLQDFISLLQKRQNISLEVYSSDSYEEISQKLESTRQMTSVILQGTISSLKSNEQNQNILQSLYYLCKHGNYSCSQPLLTKQELQLSCISSTFSFISAQKNLEKSAIINLVLIKLLLYNILLKKHIEKHQNNKILQQNLILVSSVLYELFIDVQNTYMQGVPYSYKIGNYKHQDAEVRGLTSMIVGDAKHEEGKVISGLKDSEWVIEKYRLRGWKREKKIITEIVQTSHKLIVNFHKQVTKRLK